MRQFGQDLHPLPPHLREVCDLLARGMVRLRRRTSEEFARDEARYGEVSLRPAADPSGHANPSTRRAA
jgi:hypothetical protein